MELKPITHPAIRAQAKVLIVLYGIETEAKMIQI